MIITVYIDESGTHDSGVTILGGWVGRLGQWATFDPKWRRLLRRNNLSYFHSRKMRRSKGEFKGWSRKKKRLFTQAAAKLALKDLEFGFTIALPDAAYEEHYVAGFRPKKRFRSIAVMDCASGTAFPSFQDLQRMRSETRN